MFAGLICYQGTERQLFSCPIASCQVTRCWQAGPLSIFIGIAISVSLAFFTTAETSYSAFLGGLWCLIPQGLFFKIVGQSSRFIPPQNMLKKLYCAEVAKWSSFLLLGAFLLCLKGVQPEVILINMIIMKIVHSLLIVGLSD
jgi:F0F1-type ATP synthase assembly protein I